MDVLYLNQDQHQGQTERQTALMWFFAGFNVNFFTISIRRSSQLSKRVYNDGKEGRIFVNIWKLRLKVRHWSVSFLSFRKKRDKIELFLKIIELCPSSYIASKGWWHSLLLGPILSWLKFEISQYNIGVFSEKGRNKYPSLLLSETFVFYQLESIEHLQIGNLKVRFCLTSNFFSKEF